ncbi:MAG TPA: hypothetical protein VMY76_05455 [Gemmatimonadales bacterium]|nr:hypothetical protein [Gemmatimonadales bacterium]
MRLEGRTYTVALALAITLGVAVRAYHVLSQDFPLNDGGLFYAMARDLQAARYHLPAFTSYNEANIPFGYSPLGFYLAAALDDLTPLSLMAAFRWLPLVATCLTVGAFAALARTLLASRAAVVAAVVAFALVPRSFIWMLMGGGLTRSLGMLFALVTLRQLVRMYTTRSWRLVPSVSIAAGLTLLSHLGTAPFVAFSGLLFLLAYGRNRQAVLMSVVAGIGAAVLSAPWWATVMSYHGVGPFIAAGATGGSIFSALNVIDVVDTLAHFGLGTGEPVLALIGMLGAIGFFYAMAMGDWVIPAWWITIIVTDARQGSTFATIPIAMLAGVALVHLVLPVIRHPVGVTLRRNAGRARWTPAAILGLFIVFATLSALTRNPRVVGGLPEMVALSPGERSAMAWVDQETPASAKILVVAGSPWEIDKNSEWLPVLARRVSVATVQGYEWRPVGQFIAKKREYIDVQGCAGWTTACLSDWSRRTGVWYTHVYLPKPATGACCRVLRYALDRDLDYRLVYDGPGAAIYARRIRRALAIR